MKEAIHKNARINCIKGSSAMEPFNDLWSISPIDGRYRSKLTGVGDCFSEGALIQKRIYIELKWLQRLIREEEQGQLQFGCKLSVNDKNIIEKLLQQDCKEDVYRVKEIETETNHDVKAVEYILREKITDLGGSQQLLALIHFACTSEDINNLSYGLMLQDLNKKFIVPAQNLLLEKIAGLAEQYKSLPMMARTHGQPATPTTLGKEFAVYLSRLQKVFIEIRSVPFLGKFNGAVGNFNAHYCACPEVSWIDLSKKFVENDLGLAWNPITTQIENHDGISSWLAWQQQAHSILLDLSRDIWAYISNGYLSQATVKGEVGSSTMPHKVNPIDFENAEGNLGLAQSMVQHLSCKLPVSRLQRDLSDSTAMRSIGSAVAYYLLALSSLKRGLGKIAANPDRMTLDLAGAPELLGEALQTLMRKYGYVDAYERIKDRTRGHAITLDELRELVDQCPNIPEQERAGFKQLTPKTYLGLSVSLVDMALEKYRTFFHQS